MLLILCYVCFVCLQYSYQDAHYLHGRTSQIDCMQYMLYYQYIDITIYKKKVGGDISDMEQKH
jgi:hypothetical protein